MLIAVICALALTRDAEAQPLDLVGLRLVLAIAGGSLSCFAARLIVLAARGSQRISGSGVQVDRLQLLHSCIWLASAAFLFFVVDWVTIVRTNLGLGDWILVDELLILVPLVFPWFISWAIFCDLETSSSETISIQKRLRFAWLNLQLLIGIGILPVLLMCCVGDFAEWLYPTALKGTSSVILFAVPMFLLIVAYPSVLRRLWKTRELPDSRLKNRLLEFAESNRIKIRNLLIWDTDRRVANAMVTGLLPQTRTVLFTDCLLEELSHDEIHAAMAHELGHVAKRHLLLRLLALALPLLSCSLLSAIVAMVVSDSTMQQAEHGVAVLLGAGNFEWLVTYGVVAITLVYMWLGLGWYSRQLEHEADLWACEKLRATFGDKSEEVYLRALLRLTGDSTKVGWLHPSFWQRRRLIESMAADVELRHGFSRRLLLIANVGWMICILGLIALFVR